MTLSLHLFETHHRPRQTACQRTVLTVRSGNGWLGMGWNLALPSISMDSRWGVPRYDAEIETESYLLNGDGLPDKVFKTGDDVFYRLQVAADRGNYFDAEKVQIATLPMLARESSTTFSFGPEAYYGLGPVGVNVLFNTAETFSTSNAYFSDVNGDGLVDLVIGGRVYFNHLESAPNGRPLPTFPENDSTIHSVPSTESKRQWTPQKVRSSAGCWGNTCLVGRRASGGKYKHFEVQAMLGKFELMNKDGTTADLN